ncbi:hypothetical protein F441_14804, partial [Phytophthora nicotianae CJ01A1]
SFKGRSTKTPLFDNVYALVGNTIKAIKSIPGLEMVAPKNPVLEGISPAARDRPRAKGVRRQHR